MWMQILRAGGFPVIGNAFPSNWGETMLEANPHGFYESKLTGGIGHGTNPDPTTGRYLFPDDTRQHVVKVFAAGIVRSDIAFLDRVLVTYRPWREHTASLQKIRTMTHVARDLDPSRKGEESLAPAVEWWNDLFQLIRDAATRCYPVHFQSYRGLLEKPEEIIKKVFTWLEHGDVAAAVLAVDRALHHNRQGQLQVPAPDLPPGCVEVFDELYDRLDHDTPLDDTFVTKLNETQQALIPVLAIAQARAQESAIRAYMKRISQAPGTEPSR
ncbi:MAG: hypothetical protein JW751_15655 [Polyangiaceae bacterium]|nr:hypothetical protein [Polyangiaceae bacterium]